MNQDNFKSWLKEKLSASGMSAMEFANKAKISKPLVYFYLSGQRLPTGATLNRIADALGTSADEVQHLARKSTGRPPNPK